MTIIGQSIAADKTLKIGMPPDFAPYSYLNDSDVPTGLLVDYWKLWQSKTGIKVEFIVEDIRGIEAGITSGKIDIPIALYKSKQRQRRYEFHASIIKTYSDLFVYRSNLYTSQTIEELNHQIIGVVEHTFHERYLVNKYPKVKIKRYKNFKALAHATLNKEISGFFNERQSILARLNKYNKAQQLIRLTHQDIAQYFYVATPKESAFRKVIATGVAKITDAERNSIINRWLLNIELLQQSVGTQLDSKERAWLAESPNLTLAADNQWTPLNYLDNGQLIGFHVDLIELINSNLGINLSLQPYENWNDAVSAVISGTTAGIIGLSKTQKRAKDFLFSPFYLFAPIDLVVQNSNNNKYSIGNLNNLKVATFRGHAINDIILQASPDVQLIELDTAKKVLEQITLGNVDVAVFSIASKVELKRFGLKVSSQIYNDIGRFSIGTNHSNSMFQRILSKGIRSITPQQMNELHQKWIAPFQAELLFTNLEQQYIQNADPITVGIEHWSPIIFANRDNLPNGITGELLREIEIISGLKFKAVSKGWLKLVGQYHAKEIDILPTTIKTARRQDWGIFSSGYLNLNYGLFVKTADNSIKSLADLNGKKLAIARDSSITDYLIQNFPEIELVIAESLVEAIGKTDRGDADAVVDINLVIQNRLAQLLNTKLKRIATPELSQPQLHMLIQPEQPILASVINKSLLNIGLRTKQRIIEKWSTRHYERTLDIALFNQLAPYIHKGKTSKGLVRDIIDYALTISDIEINKTHHFSTRIIDLILSHEPNIDASLRLTSDENFYYSDSLFQFENVIISRKKDQLFISEIAELSDHKVIAFPRAHQQLGNTFKQLFSPSANPPRYSEAKNDQQMNTFLSGQADVIIIDKKIFSYLARQQGYFDLELFKFDYLLPENPPIKMAFRHQNMRDIFNKNLKLLKTTGHYQHIIDDYLLGRANAKRQFIEFCAALISKPLYQGDMPMILSYITTLRSLNYVKDIAVLNDAGKNILQHDRDSLIIGPSQLSYYMEHKRPLRVGSISIEFNNEFFDNVMNSNALIPDKSLFYAEKSAEHIDQLYREYGINASKIQLSIKEQLFIDNHRDVLYSASQRYPLTQIDGHNVRGVFPDYLQLIAEKTGLNFIFVPSKNHAEIIEKLNNYEIELGPSRANPITDRLISAPFVEFSIAIITEHDQTYISDLNELAGKTVAMPGGSASLERIKKSYPNINIQETATVTQALQLVRDNKVDAFIGHLAIAIAQLSSNFPDLKISGTASQKYQHKIAINDAHPELLSIINKVISEITSHEHKEIYSRWITIKVAKEIDYTLLYQSIALFTLLLVIALYVVKTLLKANQRAEISNTQLGQTITTLEATQHTLTNTIDNLKSTQQQLVAAEKMASLGGLVAGISHEINTPIGIGLTGISHFQLISDELIDKYQRQQMSKQDFDNFIENTQEAARLIHSNLEKTADLVHSFKQLSVDQINDVLREFDLTQYIADTLVSVRSVIKNKQLNIDMNGPQELILWSYPGAISQIITNLVLNSSIHAFASQQPGVINIDVSSTDNIVRLSISDDGKGIDSNIAQKIFEPFFTTNRQNGGSGLGLNIVYNIVTTKLQGNISCDSAVGHGATFNISFPLHIKKSN